MDVSMLQTEGVRFVLARTVIGEPADSPATKAFDVALAVVVTVGPSTGAVIEGLDEGCFADRKTRTQPQLGSRTTPLN